MNLQDIAGTALTPAWLRALPYAAGVLAVTAAAYGMYHHGYTVAAAHYEAIISKSNADHAAQIISANERTAQAEHKASAAMAAIDQHHQDDIEHEKQNSAATIAAYRAGSLRLRDEFAAHPIAGNQLPGTAASTGQRYEASSFGLQSAHVQFLVSEASRADEVADQLRACQAVVRADRGGK